MTDDPCPCCGDTDTTPDEAESSTAEMITDSAPLEAELPGELQSALGRFLGGDPVETLAEWAEEVRQHGGGGSIDVDELCLVDEETEHWGTRGTERYHFACFYDAVILAALSDRPVDIRTRSPTGAVIEARAVGTDALIVSPREAVFSFGIDETVEAPAGDDGPSLERGYAAICPYVSAFSTPAAYEVWARSVPAATVALSLDGATDLAAALVR